jgi:hypothetical protein
MTIETKKINSINENHTLYTKGPENVGICIPYQTHSQQLDNFFVGSKSELEKINKMPMSDELFPNILECAPLTLTGLLDCFATNYPERAHLLAMLVEANQFKILWLDELSEKEKKLVVQLRQLLELKSQDNQSDIQQYTTENEMLSTALFNQLTELQHWRITNKQILLSSNINVSIDCFPSKADQWLEDPIFFYPDNTDGAKWLNMVLGDWMAINNLPGADESDKLAQTFSNCSPWKTLKLGINSYPIVSGLLNNPIKTDLSTNSNIPCAIIMETAMNETNSKQLHSIVDPMNNPKTKNWQNDALEAMAKPYCGVTENDDLYFDSNWAFSMLAIEYGGKPSITSIPESPEKLTLQASKSIFQTDKTTSTLTRAKMGWLSVRKAKFGGFLIHTVTLPSCTVILNIRDIGQIKVPIWDSFIRIRLNLIAIRPQGTQSIWVLSKLFILSFFRPSE